MRLLRPFVAVGLLASVACGGKTVTSTGGGSAGAATGTSGGAESSTILSGTVLIIVPTAADLSSEVKTLGAKRVVSTTAASGKTCQVYHFTTGSLLASGTTDGNGKFSITISPLPEADGDGALRFQVSCAVNSSDTESAYFEVASSAVGATTEMTEPVDPDSERTFRSLVATINGSFGSFSEGNPLPTSAITAIRDGTFAPRCYDDYLKATLKGATDLAAGGTEAMLAACRDAQSLGSVNCNLDLNDIAAAFASGAVSASTITSLAGCVASSLGLTSTETESLLTACNSYHQSLGTFVAKLSADAADCKNLETKKSEMAQVVLATNPQEITNLAGLKSDDFFSLWTNTDTKDEIGGIVSGAAARTVATFMAQAGGKGVGMAADADLQKALLGAVKQVETTGVSRDNLAALGRAFLNSLKDGGAAAKTLFNDAATARKLANLFLNNATFLDPSGELKKVFDYASFFAAASNLGVDSVTTLPVDNFLAGDTEGDGTAETAPPICRTSLNYCGTDSRQLADAGKLEPTFLSLAGTWREMGTCVPPSVTSLTATGARSPFTISFELNGVASGGPLAVVGNQQCTWTGDLPGITSTFVCSTLTCSDTAVSGACELVQHSGRTPCTLDLSKGS